MNLELTEIREKVCGGCKKPNQRFYIKGYCCIECNREKSRNYANKRWQEDAEWRAGKLQILRDNYDLRFDSCECGNPKTKGSLVCMQCWKTPSTTCIKCGVNRDDHFSRNMCYPCIRKGSIESKNRPGIKERDKLRAKKYYLAKHYGLTQEEFDELLLSQNNKCAICLSDDWGAKGPSVDHDHTKEGREAVRGLLCSLCNNGIGSLGDTAAGLKQAHNYLATYEEGNKTPARYLDSLKK